MQVDIYLREVSTGFSRVYKNDFDYKDGEEGLEHCIYMYEEGNFACDCNRALFLFDWGKFDSDSPDTYEVCSDNKIMIDKIVNRETGEVIYEESEDYDK